MNQTVYNNTVFTNDMWDEQDIYDATTGVNDYTGGRMYTVWYKGTELMVNTSDMYFYPQYVVNNTQTFDLGPMVPTSSFSVNVTPSGNIPNTPVQFTDTSTNGPVIAWAWSLTDFSNATITPYVFSTLQNPVNTFGTGNFSISLAITTSIGTFTSAQNTWINVSAGIPRSGISTSTNYSFVQSDNIYNVPIDMLAIDPRSPAWINNITDTAGAHMYMDRNIPYNYVDANITKSKVILTYPYSSTGALMPIPDNALVETPTVHGADHEVYFFDPDEGYMGDGYNSTPPRQPNGTFWFGQDSWYSLSSYNLNTTPNQGILVRPPIIRQQEAVNQNISHATQFYVQYAEANPGNVWPYYGNIGNTVDKESPAAGARIRLNASFDVSGFNLTEQHVLNGLKKYGAVIVDYTGADYFGIHLEQTNDVSHYNTSIVYSSIPRSAFEFVDESQLMISPDSMQANINIAPTASFTTNASASGITTAMPVQFTDTSTGSYTINAWNWSIENYAITPVTSNTISTSQNFVQTLGTGNYSIALTVTNTQGISNLSTRVTFVNVSPSSSPNGFSQQDIWMVGLYQLVIQFTDSSTGAIIPVVSVSDNNGGVQTTTNGTYTGLFPYSIVAITAAATGYSSKQVSFVVDGTQGIQSIQLSPSVTTNPNPINLLYPREVQYTILDRFGNRLSNVTVTSIMMSSSISNTNWYNTLFGISNAATPVTSTLLTGMTDSDGVVAFPMIASGLYTLTITDSSRGISAVKTSHPDQQAYTYVVATTATTQSINVNALYNGTLYATNSSGSYVNLNLSYTDLSATTDHLMYYVNAANMTRIVTVNVVPPYTYPINIAYGVSNKNSAGFVWGYYANSTLFGNVSGSQGITLQGVTGQLLVIDPCGGYATGWGNTC